MHSVADRHGSERPPQEGALMRMKLADQSAIGILGSLIACLVLEDRLDGLSTLLHAMRYLNGAVEVGC